MNVFGELKNADLHNLTPDPTAGKVGRIYFNTATGKVMVDDGTLIRALLRNDGNAIFGSDATASNNVRFHRASAGHLQVVLASDTTAEGSLSNSVAQLGHRLTNYTFATLPPVGNIGRIVWVTDRNSAYLDNGTAWAPLTVLESYAFASLPAAGKAGRQAWVSDRSCVYVDTGSTWRPINVLETFTSGNLPAAGIAGRMIWRSDLLSAQVDTGAQWAYLAGGGGGGSLQWVEDLDAPTSLVEYNNQVYSFGAGFGQILTTIIKVPATYGAGNAIKLKTYAYSSDTANTAIFQTVTTLIQPGTDAISSTTNQNTSSSTLNFGSPANCPQPLTLNLSDSSGKVNGVSVTPGALLIVKLSRLTSDTSAQDAKLLAYATEITFN